MNPRNYRLRYASLDDAARVFSFLVPMHAELNAPLELDPGRAYASVRDVLREGVCLVVETEDGQIAAALGLMITPRWYARGDSLMEIFHYAAPEYRDGQASALMLAELAALCDRTGSDAMLTTGIDRPRKPRGRMQMIAHALRYIPHGARFVMWGQE